MHYPKFKLKIIQPHGKSEGNNVQYLHYFLLANLSDNIFCTEVVNILALQLEKR